MSLILISCILFAFEDLTSSLFYVFFSIKKNIAITILQLQSKRSLNNFKWQWWYRILNYARGEDEVLFTETIKNRKAKLQVSSYVSQTSND